MKKDSIHVAFDAPLNKLDREDSTYGCRANNPDICSNNSLEGICAYVCNDGI